MTARNWYSIRASAAGGEILIFDVIGGPDGLSAKQFAADLKPHANAKTLTIRINSPGGSVFDASSIFNQLKRHPARKTVHVDGIAASAASVIAMAGDEIVMPENALLMIHDPHALCVGTAVDMRAMAVTLDKAKDTLIVAYRRSGKSNDVIAGWMTNETWFVAEEAVAAGLADRVADPVKIAASFDLGKFGYRHPPRPDVGAAWGRVISAKFAAR